MSGFHKLGHIFDANVWVEYRLNGHHIVFKPGLVPTVYPCGIFSWSYLSCYTKSSTRRKVQRGKHYFVLPGPMKSKLTVNSYLSPLVEDLKVAWVNGLKDKTSDGTNITIHLALTFVACDVLASRKVCGFLGHNQGRIQGGSWGSKDPLQESY